MANAKTIEPDQDQSHPVVELRIRATPDQLPVLRALASAIAIHENFDLDAIADIKLAMDEICTHLIVRSTEGAVLVCRLQFLAGTLRVAVSTTTNEPDDFSPRSFGWRVLETLTDSVDITQEPSGGATGYVTTMEFSKTNGMYS
ncbi:ATP-binding protein [Rhodococcus triatomae]|uniref:Serine/threonine-protein kinase RsbW n=1 Tax=Rhodococcus triatomae TaxID=300028 RepID=A0A1G8RMM7_9NOCA|nr:ATP-binding protein [Rhodococcus triatomae]QNG19902.1 ATP-binding protein [Rhodococcus triatomae]QNG24183.1 ATP-binding protein [Rhodococcus triatomae]SDJ18153.1 serine/threonine-protein kinase RsbW [Rhodococcus triatomae]